MFAPAHHPAMRHAAPVRRELGTRTVFNLLGPLTNPAGVRAGIFGVYAPELVRTIADVLAALGSHRAFVVHGAHGIDELSPAGPNARLRDRRGRRPRADDRPERARASAAATPTSSQGGTAEENARTAREILAGAPGREARRCPAQRGRRDRGRRARRRPLARVSRSRPRRSTAAVRPSGWRSSSPSPRRIAPDGTLSRRARTARPRRRSPRSSGVLRLPGDLRPDADPAALAAAYERAGAAAVSVLVDERFGGTWDDLRAARAASGAPLLAKGFFSTEDDLRTARDAGADAALLILRDLDDATCTELLRAADGTRPRDARRGTRPRGARPRRDARSAGHRDQRARPLDVSHRSPRPARPRRAGPARPGRHRRVGQSQTRAQGAEAELAGADAILVGSSLMRRIGPGGASSPSSSRGRS